MSNLMLKASAVRSKADTVNKSKKVSFTEHPLYKSLFGYITYAGNAGEYMVEFSGTNHQKDLYLFVIEYAKDLRGLGYTIEYISNGDDFVLIKW